MLRQCATICLSFFIISLAVRTSDAAPKPDSSDEVLNGPNGLTAYVNKKGANIRVHRVVNDTNSSNNSSKEHGFGQTGVVEVFLDAIEELDANLDNPKGGAIKIICPTPDAYASGNDDVILYGVNGLVAYVNKKGANVRVHRDLNGTGNNNEHGFGETGVVEIFLDTIEELDANLGKLTGNQKTSSFANVDFLVETVYNVSLPLSMSSNVTADCLNCSATLVDKVGDGAKISLAVCAINKDATLDMNGELTNVTAGQVKITFTMVDWPWYGNTDKLAVDIVIKVPPGRSVYDVSEDTNDKPANFTLGTDSFVEFSRMVYEDGTTWRQMPSGYPKYTSNGANNQFRLILGHFVKSSIYDPNLEVGYQSDQSADNESNGHRSTAQLLFVALLAVLSMVSRRIL